MLLFIDIPTVFSALSNTDKSSAAQDKAPFLNNNLKKVISQLKRDNHLIVPFMLKDKAQIKAGLFIDEEPL